jgi:hypothetical protein
MLTGPADALSFPRTPQAPERPLWRSTGSPSVLLVADSSAAIQRSAATCAIYLVRTELAAPGIDQLSASSYTARLCCLRPTSTRLSSTFATRRSAKGPQNAAAASAASAEACRTTAQTAVRTVGRSSTAGQITTGRLLADTGYLCRRL